jgi:hypothetical protein
VNLRTIARALREYDAKIRLLHDLYVERSHVRLNPRVPTLSVCTTSPNDTGWCTQFTAIVIGDMLSMVAGPIANGSWLSHDNDGKRVHRPAPYRVEDGDVIAIDYEAYQRAVRHRMRLASLFRKRVLDVAKEPNIEHVAIAMLLLETP